ncbi:hypothetical protein AMTRI_Chr04g183780 [Amborella trichopoda]
MWTAYVDKEKRIFGAYGQRRGAQMFTDTTRGGVGEYDKNASGQNMSLGGCSLKSKTHRTRDNIVIPTYTSSHPRTSNTEPSIEELHDFQVCTLQLEEEDSTQYSEEYIAAYLAAKLERKQRKINKAFIKKDYLSEENKNIREWYLQRFQPPRLMELLHKKYNKFLHKERLNIGFFHWLKDLCLEKNITIPSFDKIQTIEEKTYISTDGTTTASIHPPEKSIILKTSIPKKNEPVHSPSFYDIVATPYKAIPKEINKKQEYIPHIVEQNNYTNLYLQSLGKQTERIERIVSKELPTVSPIPKSVLFKPPPELNKNKFHIGENNKSLMDRLISKLSQLDLKGVPSPQIHIPPSTITSQIPESSDKGKAAVSYSGRSIVNWQIDGLSELKILDVMRHMTMYASANKMAGNHDQEVAKAIVNGFTGWLRGWWDFYVDDDTKQRILNNTRQWTGRNEQNQEVIYTESDAVNTLIYTITLHFVGSTSLLAARSEDLLSNLRCPTLSHYKWYKDVFFSRLLIREDCQLDHWREKFIAGLPYLFAERVKERLRKKHNGIIVYSSYTLGELSAEICAEGLALCTDMKLKRQIDKQKLTKKKELGDFCEQFGYYLDRKNMPDYVKKKKRKYKKEKYIKAKKKNKDKEYYKKSKRKLIKKFSPNTKRKSKLPVCYRCGKIGHYKHQCKLKKKVDSLNLDDSIKAKIKSIMSYDSSSSTSSSSYTEEINSNDLDLIGSDSSSTNTETTTESSEDCSCPLPQHNVHTLTQEDNFILDIIDKITNPEEKRAIITQFINITKNKSKSPIIKNPNEYNFSAIIKRVSDQHTSQKEPTISDLKKEIKEIKSEIVQLKGRIQILELQQMLFITYKLSNASVCNNHQCIDTPFIMVKGLSQSVILGVPFLTLLYPLTINEKGISSTIQNIPIHFNFIHKPKLKELNNVKSQLQGKEKFLCTLKQEIKYKVIEEQLQMPSIQQKIQSIQKQIETSICSEHPNAFWDRKKHSISLPYEPTFTESQIPTKARPIQMNTVLLEMCKKEIAELHTVSPWVDSYRVSQRPIEYGPNPMVTTSLYV